MARCVNGTYIASWDQCEDTAMERRLAAILAGDIVGYSRLMADDEAGTYDSLRSAVAEVVLPSVAAHGGRAPFGARAPRRAAPA